MKSGMILAVTVISAVSFVSATSFAQTAAGVPTNGIAPSSALPQKPLKPAAPRGTVSSMETPPASTGQAALPATAAPFVDNTSK